MHASIADTDGRTAPEAGSNDKARAAWWITGLATAGVLVFFVEPHVYRARYLRVLEASSVPLVDAIRAYEADTGYAPPALDQLVPKYIDRLPSTGYRPVPAFSYARGPGREWTLEVPSTSLLFDVDAFQYYSPVPGWRLVPADEVR